jgi:hypothetical protein
MGPRRFAYHPADVIQLAALQRLLNAAKVEAADLTTQVGLAQQQEAALKAEIRRLQRNDVRDTVNMEYLKNIVVSENVYVLGCVCGMSGPELGMGCGVWGVGVSMCGLGLAIRWTVGVLGTPILQMTVHIVLPPLFCQLRFLTFPAGAAERGCLIPVLSTLLQLTPQELKLVGAPHGIMPVRP